MSMSSAQGFSYAISGSFTDDAINKYAEYVNNTTSMLQNAGGWLGQQATKTLENFDNFLNSRAWEMSKRLLGKEDGEFVSRYAIGYLGSVNALQGAEGYMRDYIMAHPGIMRDYIAEEIEGYGGEFSHFCTGVAEENLFYRRAMNGLLNLQTVEDKVQLRHTQFTDTLGGKLPFRERVDIQKTWRAVDMHRAKNMFDVTSPKGAFLKSYVPPEEVSPEE